MLINSLFIRISIHNNRISIIFVPRNKERKQPDTNKKRSGYIVDTQSLSTKIAISFLFA